MQNQTNTTTNTNTNNSGINTGSSNVSNTGASTGNSEGISLSNLSRELLGQQAEILSKIEVLLSNQNRLERALQNALLANNVNPASLTGIDAGVNASV